MKAGQFKEGTSLRGLHCGAVLFLAFLFVTPLYGSNTFDCPTAKDYRAPHRIAGYVVRILPGSSESPYRCRGTITPLNGTRVTVAQDWAMSLDPISGGDINGDGIPKVVFDGFSGDETYSYTYWIVSLEKKPRIVRQIRNQVPLVFSKRPDGVTEIRTGDGSFDLLFLPHSDAAIPNLVLQLQGSELIDVSSHYREEYDRQIAKARSELTTADLDKFRQSHYSQSMFSDQLPTVKRVLTIVLAYLYSGRESQAWQAMDEMWPPSDKQRAQDLILERRARGLLGSGTTNLPKVPDQAR